MNTANKISLVRLFLTPIFILSVLYYRAGHPLFSVLPLVIFLFAILTDAIDGYIARRYNQITKFGTVLDPLADKLLLLTSFVILTFSKTLPPHLRIPPWVLIIILTRDIFIVIGASIIYMMFEYIEFRPSILGKITTFFQMITILGVLLRFEHSYILWNAAVAFTVLSGIHYLIRANRILNEKAKRYM